MLAEKEREIAKLQERLARQTGGSLFDLKGDTAADIGQAIANNIGESKFETIVKAAKEHYKAKRRPAG
jgi:hypothetical protein